MGICDSKNSENKKSIFSQDKRKNQKIETTDISYSDNYNSNKYNLESSQTSENIKSNEKDNELNNHPELEKYERSMAKKSEISHAIQNGSEFSSKISEEEIIIRGEINKECPNKEKDFDNNSFMRLVKNKGGLIINEDNQSNTKSDKNKLKINYFNAFGKDNISEIKSQISFQTNNKSKNSIVNLINGKINKMDYQSENKFTYYSMNQNHLDFNKSLKNDKKSYYSNKTSKPKINLDKYLNGIFNTDYNINYNNSHFRKNNLLNSNHQYIYNNNIHNLYQNKKISLISYNNNKSNESTSDDLMGSFISIPQNDERIPECDLKIDENGEDIISSLS